MGLLTAVAASAIPLVLVIAAPLVSAENWGAGQSDYDVLCTNPLSEPDDFPNSECANKDSTIRVWISGSMHSQLGSALRNSMDEDFDPVTGFAMNEMATQWGSDTDAQAFYSGVDPTRPISYTYCATGAETGHDDVRYYMWCRPHQIVFQQTNAGNNCWNQGTCRRRRRTMKVDDRLGRALRPLSLEDVPDHVFQRSIEALPDRQTRASRLMVGAGMLGLAAGLVITAVVGSVLLMPLSTQGPGMAADSPPQTGEPITAPPITDRPSTRAPAVVNPTVPPSPPLAPDARTEKERSDDFWNSITDFANYGFVYDDLEAITGDSDLVVVGRVVGFQLGQIEQFDPDPQGPQGAMAVTFGLVEVEVVLKGEAAMMTPGLIQVARLGRRDMTETDLPKGRVILFLKNYAQMRIDEGVPPSSDEDDRYYYARPNGYQGALREMDGVVDLIVPPGLEDVFEVSFPGQLDGHQFQEVIAQIETLAVEWRRPDALGGAGRVRGLERI